MSHRVFVSEYICGGAWSQGPLDNSLAIEGQSMLAAIVSDLLRISDVLVMTTLDARLQQPSSWIASTSLEVSTVSSPEQEAELFRELSRRADSVLVIAPEFENLLADRCRLVESQNGSRLCGCSSQAVQFCADKLTLAEQLKCAGIETIPTASFNLTAPDSPYPYPFVIKPRIGAGSQFTFRIDRPDELTECVDEIAASAQKTEFIQQPFVPGVAASAGAIFGNTSDVIDIFPAGQQVLSDDRRFQYVGCDLPGPFSAARQEQIATLICQSRDRIPGLNGYVGFDLIIPEDHDQTPVLVEINPRLTTGYLAWRKLTADNLSERILHPSTASRQIRWHRRLVRFRLDDLTQ